MRENVLNKQTEIWIFSSISASVCRRPQKSSMRQLWISQCELHTVRRLIQAVDCQRPSRLCTKSVRLTGLKAEKIRWSIIAAKFSLSGRVFLIEAKEILHIQWKLLQQRPSLSGQEEHRPLERRMQSPSKKVECQELVKNVIWKRPKI